MEVLTIIGVLAIGFIAGAIGATFLFAYIFFGGGK